MVRNEERIEGESLASIVFVFFFFAVCSALDSRHWRHLLSYDYSRRFSWIELSRRGSRADVADRKHLESRRHYHHELRESVRRRESRKMILVFFFQIYSKLATFLTNWGKSTTSSVLLIGYRFLS